MNKFQVRNEAVIYAPVNQIWAVITDITLLHLINPGVISAAGRMDRQGETRTCELDQNGKRGKITERLIELVPESKTVWTIESDTMGMSKMLKDSRFIFQLEKIDESKTMVTSETWYREASFIVKIMNILMVKRKIAKAQEQILTNIKSLTEKK